MLDRGPTLRADNHWHLREIAGHGAALIQWAFHGFGLGSHQHANISGLGTRLLSLRLGDPAIAEEIARGKFSFAGETVTGIPIQIFDQVPPSTDWAQSLHNLSWLQHFVAGDHELHRIVARSLIVKWGEQRQFLWAAPIHFRALISLSCAAHFLVGPSPSSFKEPFLALVEKLIRRALFVRPNTGPDRLLQAIALQYASLAFRSSPALRDDANAKFCAEINQVILPDGGHVSRDPLALLETLLEIIPVQTAMGENREPVPQPLNAAIERMVPMLRMLSHGDGGLSNFQGSGAADLNGIKAILAQDKVHGQPLLLAPHSGYCRLAHRAGLLIMDVGAPKKCNSALAFEFSEGPHRIISNCGMPLTASTAWQDAASGIAAHNTIEIAGLSNHVENRPQAEVINSPLGTLINSRNRISNGTGAIIHERKIFLSQNGRDLRGEDHCHEEDTEKSSANDRAFTIRFHLHPAVKATSIRRGTKFVIVLPNRAAWQFSARGGNLSLEESIYLADDGGPRKTLQIAIRGSTGNTGPIKWALRRVEKAANAEEDMAETPRLPF